MDPSVATQELIQRVLRGWIDLQPNWPEADVKGAFSAHKAQLRCELFNTSKEQVWAGLNTCGIACDLVYRDMELRGMMMCVNALKIGTVLIDWEGCQTWSDLAHTYFPQIQRDHMRFDSGAELASGREHVELPSELLEIILHELRGEILSEIGDQAQHAEHSGKREFKL